jgi:drug/metabolite transporter (DMT)-like permease
LSWKFAFFKKNVAKWDMPAGQITPNDVADDLFQGSDIAENKPVAAPKYVAKSQLIGILGVLAGVVFLVTANVLGTKFGRSGLWITMWRSFMAVVILGAYVKFRKQNITIESVKYCLAPAIAFTIHIVCFYQAIQDTSLSNVVVIRSLQPPLTLFFVGAAFNEKVKGAHIVAAVTAFLGVALTVWGSTITGANNVRGDILAVCALCGWIGLFIFTKKARQHVGTATFMFLTTCLSGIVATCILPFTGVGLVPHKIELVKLLAMAISASLGHGFISWAHRYTKLTTASLLTLLTPVGSTICAAIFFDQKITFIIGLGVAVVMASVATIIGYERKDRAQLNSADLDNAKAA